MIKAILRWFEPASPPPKWRLVPDTRGTYMLEKWNSSVGAYLAEDAGVKDEREAARLIRNHDGRNIKYFIEEQDT